MIAEACDLKRSQLSQNERARDGKNSGSEKSRSFRFNVLQWVFHVRPESEAIDILL